MKNITLVEAAKGMSELGVYQRHGSFDPIGLEYLGAVLDGSGYNIFILKQRKESSKEFLEKILSTNPDLVGFSTYSYNFQHSKNLAAMIKGTNPEVYTVFGNVHISSHPTDVDDTSIDFGIMGEGEYVIRDLVKALDKGYDVRNLESLVYWSKGVKINPRRGRIENLDELPFPLRTEDLIKENKTVLMYPSTKEQKLAAINYSRGCTFACPYCSSDNIWGKNVNWRSAKNLVDEIEYLKKKYDINTLFFTDLTFNLNKEKISELCDEIIDRDIEISWYSMLRLEDMKGKPMINRELLERMRRAGCNKVAFGIETFNEEILTSYNKKVSFENTRDILDLTHQLGIINKGYFMIGEPFLETKKTINEIKRNLTELPFDIIRIVYLTPFPGTSIYDRYKEKIITKDWARYTSEEPIFSLNNLNQEELMEARKDILSSFYTSENYLKTIRSKIRRFPHLREAFEEFFEFLSCEGIRVSL
ncbi:hypothetical protein AYK26_05390 [Euryarchaeota archaeon SM23-78]|nr:MAG: hypothetical protein AYK26_05390 [Euryarchaeota archaeon SM23-78]MBW3001035.1 B12-binding domain-containing radical SAM protein [Candidatus Woesearchaeota archaeon]